MGLERVKGKWLDVTVCEHYVDDVSKQGSSYPGKLKICGRKCTHVVFLNTPYDKPYVVGTCRVHRNLEDGFKIIPIGKLAKEVDRLLDSGVPQKDLAVWIEEKFDSWKDDDAAQNAQTEEKPTKEISL